MTKKLIPLLILSFAIAASAQVVDQRDFGYPIENPYKATLTSQMDRVTPAEFTQASLTVIPRRDRIPALEGRQGVPYAYALQKGAAPLVFVLPGLGGNGWDPQGANLAYKFYKRGAHVVVLTNPFSWQFALGASPSAAPGYLPRDAEDLYRFMVALKPVLKAAGARVTRYDLVGYSLGGGLVPYVFNVDNKAKQFRFHRGVSINPPINLESSLATLDGFISFERSSGPKNRDLVMGRLLNDGLSLIESKADPLAKMQMVNNFQISDDELRLAIGSTFHDALANIIFVNQQIRDTGILRTPPATKWRKDRRFIAARSYDFAAYSRDLVSTSLPESARSKDVRSILRSSDWRELNGSLSADSRLYVIHNADDFIYNAETDLPYLQKAYGDRWTVYPRGGHVGNLWYPPVQNRLLEILSL